MKLCRIVYETPNYSVKWILWPESKNIYFHFASEIYRGCILFKIKRKSGKYLMRLENIYLQYFPFKMMHRLCLYLL